MATDPEVEFDGRFSQPDAVATPWADARSALEEAEIFWLSTVRPGGGPHVTPVLALWRDGVLCFSTGPDEQKARNLAHEPRCALTAGGPNRYAATGLDVVVEGAARRAVDAEQLDALAISWSDRFGPDWRYERQGDDMTHQGGVVHMFAVTPSRAYAFSRAPYSQTTYRF